MAKILNAHTGDKAVCGAKTRKPNRYGEYKCLNPPMRNGTGRCRMHGGLSRRGAEHPNFKHGKYVRRDTSIEALGKRVYEVTLDLDYLSAYEEIALSRARLQELVDRLYDAEDGNLVPVYQLAREASQLLRSVKAGGDGPHAKARYERGLLLLDEALERSQCERAIWSEIRSVLADLRKSIRDEVKRKQLHQDYISTGDLMVLLTQVQQAVLDLQLTPEQAKQFKHNMEQLLQFQPQPTG